MKRNIFSCIFSKKNLFWLVFVFSILSSYSINSAKAGICVKGNDAGSIPFIRLLNSCADNSEINSDNNTVASNVAIIKAEKDKVKADAASFSTSLINTLDSSIEDNFKNSYDVKYIKNIINQSTAVADTQFDSLINGALTYQRLFFLHDQLGKVASIAQKAYIAITFKEFLSYLTAKEKSTDSNIKNSVSQKLKTFLANSISAAESDILDSFGTLYQNNIDKVVFTDMNGGTGVTITMRTNIESIMNTDPYNFSSNNYPFRFTIKDLGLDPNADTTNINDPAPAAPVASAIVPGAFCPSNVGISDFMSGSADGCSLVAYLVNSLLVGVNKLLGSIAGLIGDLFDWSMDFSIIHFKDWITDSGAYSVWRDVVLALIVSLLLPLIFYLIIRSLIDNDTDKLKKVLPRVLVTALFVYFTFYVSGWVIDISNKVALETYRALHDPAQSFGEALQRTLKIESIGDLGIKSLGDWSGTIFYIVKIIVSIVAIIVMFQATILIFIRSVVLMLVMIFSPIMLLPSGINGQLDKYRNLVISNFTNSALMAPILMLMLLVAMKIGDASTSVLDNNQTINNITKGSAIASLEPNFMGATVSSVIVIIVLQLAISTAKKMSNEVGSSISGKISSFTGGLVGSAALGGVGSIARMGVAKAAKSKGVQGWMKRNEGTRRGQMAYNLLKGAKNSTFDLRNNKTFQKATKGALGAGSAGTVDSLMRNRYAKERDYHDTLTTQEGKEKHLARLEKGNVYEKGAAERLRAGNDLTIGERMNANKDYDKKLDDANSQVDTEKREEEILKTIDEHFKKNGKGENYFTEEMKKPENKELSDNLKEIIKNEKDPEKRKAGVLKLVSDFEKEKNKQTKAKNKKTKEGENGGENKKKEGNKAHTDVSQNVNVNSPIVNQNPNTTNISSGIPAPSVADIPAQDRLKERLRNKYGQVDRMVNGKMVKEIDPEIINKKIEENNIKQGRIRRDTLYSGNSYQEKALFDQKKKDSTPAKIMQNNLSEIAKNTFSISEALKNNNKSIVKELKENNGKKNPETHAPLTNQPKGATNTSEKKLVEPKTSETTTTGQYGNTSSNTAVNVKPDNPPIAPLKRAS